MNTQFNYLYRDASNYKEFGEVVLKGKPSKSLIRRLEKTLDGGEWFIAHQVDVPEVFFTWGEDSAEDDHCWHQYSSIEQTGREPTDDRTFKQFVEDFEKVSKQGWEIFDQQLGKKISI